MKSFILSQFLESSGFILFEFFNSWSVADKFNCPIPFVSFLFLWKFQISFYYISPPFFTVWAQLWSFTLCKELDLKGFCRFARHNFELQGFIFGQVYFCHGSLQSLIKSGIKGIVILMIDDQITPAIAKQLLQGSADPLNSAFHLTYNMVLNCR